MLSTDSNFGECGGCDPLSYTPMEYPAAGEPFSLLDSSFTFIELIHYFISYVLVHFRQVVK